MINCSCCNKELDRTVFCDTNCRIKYHRKLVTNGNDFVTNRNKDVTNRNIEPSELTVKAEDVATEPNDLLGDDYPTPEIPQRSSFGSKSKKKKKTDLCPHFTSGINCSKCLMDSKYRAV